MRQRSSQWFRTVVLAWLGLMIAGVFVSASAWSRLAEHLKGTGRASQLRIELEGVLSALLDEETAHLGFVLTGDDRSMASDTDRRVALSRRFERLAELARGNPTLLQEVMDLHARAALVSGFQRRVARERREKGLGAAAGLVADGEAARLMDAVRDRVSAMKGLHAGGFADPESMAGNLLGRARSAALVAGGLGVGAGLLSVWLVHVAFWQQQRERRLVEMCYRAERTSREKTVFLANMSHEIRTPMNAILGFGELLESRVIDPKSRGYLRSIRSSARSLVRLIDDILDLSKIEAGAMPLRKEPTDPREACDFVQCLFAEAAAKKGVRLEFHVAEDLPRALLFDRVRLRQILVNLVGNAVKFTDRGFVDVWILWERESDGQRATLVVEVQDTGVGIPHDKWEAIFQPFTQSGVHREVERQGSGLGLSIVRRLAELMKGTATVSSILGEGSVFRLRFPHVEISSRLPSGDIDDLAGECDFGVLVPSTILVVDDRESNRQVVAGMLEGTGHRLVFGATGLDAIRLAREARPDVILLDLRMPEMDGPAALESIRGLPGLELVPVIAVTASNRLAEGNEGPGRFSGYVRKPFTRADLFRELSQFLPRRAPPEGSTEVRTAEALPGEPGDAGGPAPEFREALLQELRRCVAVDWPGVCEALSISEIHAFAFRLETLARRADCGALLVYARRLLAHADNYEIAEVERHLQAFGTLIEKLEREGPR